MRTTLVLDDQLLRRAKRRAAERDVTLSQVVNDALREALRESQQPKRPFRLITVGGAGDRVRHEPGDFKAGLEAEDSDRLG